jgi:hypothetical protein
MVVILSKDAVDSIRPKPRDKVDGIMVQFIESEIMPGLDQE